MIEKAQHKDMQPREPSEEFFFSGSGEYKPISIRAGNREEAEKLWAEQRQPTDQKVE